MSLDVKRHNMSGDKSHCELSHLFFRRNRRELERPLLTISGKSNKGSRSCEVQSTSLCFVFSGPCIYFVSRHIVAAFQCMKWTSSHRSVESLFDQLHEFTRILSMRTDKMFGNCPFPVIAFLEPLFITPLSISLSRPSSHTIHAELILFGKQVVTRHHHLFTKWNKFSE